MATFQYRAVDASSEIVEGRMEGATRLAVVDQLQALGQVPLAIEEVSPSASPGFAFRLSRSRTIGINALTIVTRQLAVFLRAGLTLDDALRILEDLFTTAQEKRCLRLLLEKVSEGAGLADAMAAQGDA